MSRLTTLAEAIKDNLNDTTFSKKFNARRAYAPTYTLKQLKNVQVSVIAPLISQGRLTREAIRDVITVDIVIQQQVKMENNDEADKLSTLVEEIGDYLVTSAFGGARCKSVDTTSPYEMDDIGKYQVFTAVIRCEFEIVWKRI